MIITMLGRSAADTGWATADSDNVTSSGIVRIREL